MKTSPKSTVRDFYDASADSYAQMMDTEIELPMYSDILGRLAERIAGIQGPVESESSAAVLSFFALHHLDRSEILPALREWRRVLRPGGQLLLATWEGTGPIDYGGVSDVVAMRYHEGEIRDWARAAEFDIDRSVVEPVEGMPMEAVYLEGTRAKRS